MNRWPLYAAVVIGGLVLFGRRPQSSTSAGGSKRSYSEGELEALARLVVSETDKREAWLWIAVATRNAAAARHESIGALLRKVHGEDLGWGRNQDGHWASTAKPPTAESLAWARKFLAGEIPDPPGSEGVRSFYEVDEHGIQHDPSPFLSKNPELQLAQEVVGWQFYRRA